MSATVIALMFGALIALYYYLTKNYKYWQSRGIPCPDGALPGLGHMLSVISMKMPFTEYLRKLYQNNKDRSMVGFYNFVTPTLLVLEPELVKTVLQTNFANFNENPFQVDPEVDPLRAHNPFVNTGEKWLSGRKKLTYAFSTTRLKLLLESIKSVCNKLDNFLDEKLSKTGKVEIELKDLCSRYTAQVVAAAGFGVDGYCFDDKNADKSFRKIGSAIMEPSLRTNIMFFLLFFIPSLNKFLKMPFIPKYIDRFLRTLVAELLEQRRADGIPRNDFLYLMVELEKIEGDKFDTEVLAAQALSFIVDGYETTSTVLSFACYNIARHPEVQKKLREEVTTVLDKYDGVITYEALKEMTYMDQVLNESQRFVHVAGFMAKVCTKEIELKGSDGLVCCVEPGMQVMISVQGLHEDPRYWENSEEFDPERYIPDKKNSIEKFAFLPFGEGPRMCPGMRMALLIVKAGLAALLQKYTLELSPKTQQPVKMVAGTILVTPKGGLWVNIQKL
ncbi:cytochrome P450 9e2-like [Pseudomyrmex gracilis]|uniref:cytochrome P450 9e2-like n=1 Tax=Pseudomyrmex gracilis TaxID=219809 RepID=UPI00099586C3|nr:cytochrome P450 9e2-like [Pseudomyrmex gracilis]